MSEQFTTERVVGGQIDPRLIRIGDVIRAYPKVNDTWAGHSFGFTIRSLTVTEISYKSGYRSGDTISEGHIYLRGNRSATERPDLKWDINTRHYDRFILVAEQVVQMLPIEPPKPPQCHCGCCGCCPNR